MRTLLLCLLLSISGCVHADGMEKEVPCLAENLYYEARGEPIEGIIEVANVTLNRVQDKRWPNTVCGVVHQKWQFSWTHEVNERRKRDELKWRQLVSLARLMIWTDGYRFHNSGSTHYVNKKLHRKVWWTKKLKVSHRIGNHVFYY